MERSDHKKVPCDRCGLERQVTNTGRRHNLCLSCRDVVEDLGELWLWEVA